MSRDELNRRSATDILQVETADAAKRLANLSERGYLDVRGRGQTASYRLGQQFSVWDRFEPRSATEASGIDVARKIVLQALADRGSITNSDIRATTGNERNETVKLMRTLRDEGLVELRGSGRGAHYVLRESS